MRSVLARIPFRESRVFVMACTVVFLALLTARLVIQRPIKEERQLTKRKAEGKTIAPEAYVPIWLYKGLQANVVLSGVLLLASPWLGRRRPATAEYLPSPQRVPLTRWQAAACVLLVGAAAWHNSPRLFHSMWGDEEFNASRFILDYVERKDDGSMEIKQRPWTTTLWNMRKPTNHLAYSFFARLSHDTFFHKGTGPNDPWFSEALLRAPVFVAGLLLIPAFIWALRVWGMSPWWGLLLFLLHPWFTRFGVDGRGYGFVMLGATVLLGVVGRALQTGRWRWWLSVGVLGFFIIWSNLQGIYVVGAAQLTVLACLVSRGLPGPARMLLGSRWIVANVLTLALILGYLAPCWPQLQEFMAKGEIRADLDWRFWKDGLCAFAFGQPFHPWEETGNPLRYAIELSMVQRPWLYVAAMASFAALVLTGIFALARTRAQRALLVFCIGAPALMLLHMGLSGNRPYDWYFTNFLPGLFLLAAAGASLFLKACKAQALPVAALLMALALYAFVTERPRSLLRQHPIEPARESVALYRKMVNPRHPDIEKEVMSAGFSMYTEGYDPALRRFRTVEELRQLMAEADATGRRFYVNMGFMKFLRTLDSEKPIISLLDDPSVYEHVGHLHGLLHTTSRDVFRYRGQAR
ncbi:MAG: hypothetical protein ACOYMN_00565 [Roseimicrobium sp.]